MEGATATINSLKKQQLYAEDYQPTDGGETVQNHVEWLQEDELSKKK